MRGTMFPSLIADSDLSDVVFTTERPWPVGEARECEFAANVNGASCTLTMNLESPPEFHYLVAVADIDKPLHFTDGWAKAVTCRLDSLEHATWKQYALEGR